MIVWDEGLVAHVGGPSGATLSIAEPGGSFRAVAEFGLVKKAQAAAQRRLLLTAEHLFVLEPAEGVFFVDEMRVRRFDRAGRELDQVVGRGAEGRAQLAYLAAQEDAGAPLRLSLFGVDPATGQPLHAERELPPLFGQRPWRRRQIPLWKGDDLYVPMRRTSLFRFRGDTHERWPMSCGRAMLLGDRVVCVATRSAAPGVWIDGTWRDLPGGRTYKHGMEFSGDPAAAHPSGGLILLHADGGQLPVLDGPPATLPPGLYSGLVGGPGGPHAVEESGPPRLVAVEL
ncbi:MAG: hypothetical protein ACYTGZ_01320 [Planctomycetota bacterium]|jgi:hypothetical protein